MGPEAERGVGTGLNGARTITGCLLYVACTSPLISVRLLRRFDIPQHASLRL